eukprot:jgi/Mesen1/8858/ME000053S08266
MALAIPSPLTAECSFFGKERACARTLSTCLRNQPYMTTRIILPGMQSHYFRRNLLPAAKNLRSSYMQSLSLVESQHLWRPPCFAQGEQLLNETLPLKFLTSSMLLEQWPQRPTSFHQKFSSISLHAKLKAYKQHHSTACRSSIKDTVQEPQFILGIETSCDETGAAVIGTNGRVLGEALASQAELHAEWGGVVPALAQGEHERAIDGVVAEALSRAGISEADLAAVAVTIGPGLSLCLRVGVTKARLIAKRHQLPLVPVHHMEAHALVARQAQEGVEFPFLTLLISVVIRMKLLSLTCIDFYAFSSCIFSLNTRATCAIRATRAFCAAGWQAYDKTARLLGLDLSRGGGPALEAMAVAGDPKRFRFSVPMRSAKTCDFSYAGLKTAVRLAIDANLPGAESRPVAEDSEAERQLRADICASFQSVQAMHLRPPLLGCMHLARWAAGWATAQHVAVQHLEDRTARAIELARQLEPSIDCLVVAGGVAANAVVRARLQAVAEARGMRLVCPPPHLCTDNGVMVAWAGLERFRLGLIEPPPQTDEPDFVRVDIRARWPLGEALSPPVERLRSSKRRGVFPSLTSLSPTIITSSHAS